MHGTVTVASMCRRRARLDRSTPLPAAAHAVPSSALGALFAANVPTGYVRPVVNRFV